MSAKVFSITDWERGTNPPFRFNFSDSSGPRSLVGCVVAMAIKGTKEDNSLTDEAAAVKKRVECWEVMTADELVYLTEAAAGDVCWVTEEEAIRVFSGSEWVQGNTAENRILEGQLTFRFTREEMLIPVGTYYYSVDIKFPNGEVAKVLKGSIKITYNTVNEM